MTEKDCYCFRCRKYFHRLGIARHKAMHRDRKEPCRIMFSDGYVRIYAFDANGGVK